MIEPINYTLWIMKISCHPHPGCQESFEAMRMILPFSFSRLALCYGFSGTDCRRHFLWT